MIPEEYAYEIVTQVNAGTLDLNGPDLHRAIAAAVSAAVAAEREACAMLAESMRDTADGTNRYGWGKANSIAAAIRARSNGEGRE